MKVAVIGTGYVGLVTGACLAEQGHSVCCVDTEEARVAAVMRAESPILEDGLPELIERGRRAGRLTADVDLAGAVADADVSMICVGTPSTGAGIDLGFVRAAAAQIGAALARSGRYHVVTVKSTVVPGTTAGLVRPLLEQASGKPLGAFGLCVNPEFLSQGSAVHDFMEPDRIVIGEADARSGDVLEELYAGFACPKLRMSTVNAEMVKYAANAFQATLISFANQIGAICEHTAGADEAAVMRAVHLDRHLTPPGGEPAAAARFLRAGIGFGGSCFPKDVAALRHYAHAISAPSEMLDAVLDTNAARPKRVLALLEEAIGQLRSRTIAVLGLTFKPDTDDLRESPGVHLMRHLIERGARARGHDPLAVARYRAVQELPDEAVLTSTAEDALSGADAAVIATGWPQYRDLNWRRILPTMRHPVILDGRNLLRGIALPASARLIRVGVGTRDTLAREASC